jgi:hypothetical protein
MGGQLSVSQIQNCLEIDPEIRQKYYDKYIEGANHQSDVFVQKLYQAKKYMFVLEEGQIDAMKISDQNSCEKTKFHQSF